jgi:hypothetical protein
MARQWAGTAGLVAADSRGLITDAFQDVANRDVRAQRCVVEAAGSRACYLRR